MKNRYFLEIAYCGTNYHGWQIQPNNHTVQAEFEDRLSKKLREPIRSYGCGRTDAAVHASQYFVQFDTEQELNANLVYELNSFLPRDIAVKAMYLAVPQVDGKPIHARFDAYERQYEYYLSQVKDPFGIGRVTSVGSQKLDIELMQKAAELLPEYKVFKTFSKLDAGNKNYECTMYWAKWEQEGDKFKFTISANRFLRSMVRKIVGTMLLVGTKRMSIAEMRDAIESEDPAKAGLTAPPDGLYLSCVKYPEGTLQKLI